MMDKSKKAKGEGHLDAVYELNGVRYLETCGDTHDTPCPWCGAFMNLSDDGAYAESSYTCEHCDADMALSADYSVTVTATVKDEDADKDIKEV